MATDFAEEIEGPPKIPCVGKGKVCVSPNQCDKGFIDGNTLTRSYNYVSLFCHQIKHIDTKI